MMKTLLLPIVIILFAITAKAQDTGMPKELTCTERAFNFSFGIGTGWKFIAPKMGPVEAPSSGTIYNPAWGMKVNPAVYETGFAESYLGDIIHLQNDASIVYPNKLRVSAIPGYLIPGIKLSPAVKSSALWPNIPLVSDRIISNAPNLARE